MRLWVSIPLVAYKTRESSVGRTPSYMETSMTPGRKTDNLTRGVEGKRGRRMGVWERVD